MRFVDTNIFLRLLTNDDPAKASACEKLFRRAVERREALFTTEMVIAEIVWVLESYYELDRPGIREMVEKILNTRNLECPNREILIQALSTYVEKRIDFIDAYNGHVLRHRGIFELYSYDHHFDHLAGLQRIEP